MSDDIVCIPLHRDTGPPLRNLIVWAMSANVLVFSFAFVAFGVVPWLSGERPEVSVTNLVATGFIAFFATFAIIVFQQRRSARKRAQRGSAELRIGGEIALHDLQEDRVVFATPADAVQIRRMSALDPVDGDEYYVGPALQFAPSADDKFVIASLDSGSRWLHDPPSVRELDWVCTRSAWQQLVDVLELDGELTEDDGG